MGAYLDFMGMVEWVNSYVKKQSRSLLWRLKAAMKKAGKNRSKQQFKFQYDPSSYALNFDEGYYCHSGVGANSTELARLQDCSEWKNIMWVYVLWVKP